MLAGGVQAGSVAGQTRRRRRSGLDTKRRLHNRHRRHCARGSALEIAVHIDSFA